MESLSKTSNAESISCNWFLASFSDDSTSSNVEQAANRKP